ncbi:CBS domain-containing protein [Haloarcula salina]|uniref:CBS domain-containing protein n=1 Tax=Haloarcula salina TaxID=1429914 RepID=A0AA41KEN4_9EURY|nr:CBS domain-containing protein [Haloarcula salina]MBV0901107.1 CBS domain-containing protein [Haloarcula salina]
MNGEVTVQEVMNREYVGASESDDLLETTELLIREDQHPILVLRGNEPVGVATDRDILAYVVDGGDPSTATIGDVMREAIPTVDPEASLPEARDRMAARSAEFLVVTAGGEPMGTLTEHDILSSARLESESTETPETVQQVATTGQQAATEGMEPATADTFDEQGICSDCGTLTRDLASFNGQLLCPDCRDV